MSEMDELVARLQADLDRTERNRDMWKGQCERQAEELARLRTLGERMAEALKCVLDDSHSYESEGYARDHARTALAAWNEGAWRNAARTGGASPGLFPNPTPLRGRSA